MRIDLYHCQWCGSITSEDNTCEKCFNAILDGVEKQEREYFQWLNEENRKGGRYV